MLLALLLAACVAPPPAALEWVEISQQHYHKPARAHPHFAGAFYPANEETSDDGLTFSSTNDYNRVPDKRPHEEPIYFTKEGKRRYDRFPTDRRPIYEDHIEEIKPQSIYPNHSIIEHNWNKNRVSNIKRVDNNVKIKRNITPEFSMEIYGEVIDSKNEQVTSDYGQVKDKEIVSATVERVSNKGSVKRVQLSNTPVKSPTVINVGQIKRNHIKHGSFNTDDNTSDEFEIKANIFKNSENVGTSNYATSFISGAKETTTWKFDRMSSSTTEPIMIFTKYPRTHQLHSTNNINKDNFNITSTAANKGDHEETIDDYKPHSVVKTDKFVNLENVDSNETVMNKFSQNNTIDRGSKDFTDVSPNDEKTKLNHESSSKKDHRSNEEIKVNTMENVMKFIKVVADTISKNTNRGVNGKVKYLNELKNTLLSSIKERIDTTWADDSGPEPARGGRRARAARGHVEFPSSESSLMTISFLTFAVFLIKLVLQVIQTYKNKTMMVAPLVVATAGRALPKWQNVN